MNGKEVEEAKFLLLHNETIEEYINRVVTEKIKEIMELNDITYQFNTHTHAPPMSPPPPTGPPLTQMNSPMYPHDD